GGRRVREAAMRRRWPMTMIPSDMDVSACADVRRSLTFCLTISHGQARQVGKRGKNRKVVRIGQPLPPMTSTPEGPGAMAGLETPDLAGHGQVIGGFIRASQAI